VTAGIVVDASVAVKWLVDEIDSELADEVARVGTLIAPDFIVLEIANALGKRCRARVLSVADAERLRLAAESYFDELARSADVLGRALDLAVTLDHPLYDCLYLALAEARSLPLVTADETFVRKAARLPGPARVRLLAEWSL
jgi:predicted nucleic acid-binding protein